MALRKLDRFRSPALPPTARRRSVGRRHGVRAIVLRELSQHEPPRGLLAGIRLAAESGTPASQSLDGPGFETGGSLKTGLQGAF